MCRILVLCPVHWTLILIFPIPVWCTIMFLAFHLLALTLFCQVCRVHHRFFLALLLVAFPNSRCTIRIFRCIRLNILIMAEIEMHQPRQNQRLVWLTVLLDTFGVSMFVAIKTCCTRVTRWRFGMWQAANEIQCSLLGENDGTTGTVAEHSSFQARALRHICL